MVKKSTSILCALSVLASVWAVSPIERKPVEKGSAQTTANLWSAPIVQTILQDPEDMAKNDIPAPKVLSQGDLVELNIDMVQGETEGAQLIVTPQTTVNAYTLTVSDLVNLADPTQVIDGDTVEIFKQYYTKVEFEVEYGRTIPLGMYPDMLLPLDVAIEAGENNIQAGKNQGFILQLKSYTEGENFARTYYEPGVYVGTATLTLDGVPTEIPFSVKVRDIQIDRARMVGTAASAAMLSRSTYEMLLDYHVQPQYPPEGNYTPESLVREVAYYWDDPDFTCYEIPNVSANAFYEYAYALAKASTPKRNYLTRALCYIQVYDEPHDGAYAALMTKPYTQMKQTIISELGLTGEVAEAVRNIGIYYTSDIWVKTMRAEDYTTDDIPASFCISNTKYKYEEIYLEYMKEAKCVAPFFYANGGYQDVGYSLPALGQGIRSMGWISSQYDMLGHLFWDIDTRMPVVGPNGNGYPCRDWYDDIHTFTGTNSGNGMIIYPAAGYGLPGEWFPSIRLMNFRDGSDDYDLLYQLETLYNDGLLEGYGITEDFDELVRWIYERGVEKASTYYPDDGTAMLGMRETVMDLIELAKKGFVSGGITLEGATAKADFYSKSAPTFLAGGVTLTPTVAGDKYHVEWNGNEAPAITVSVAGTTRTWTVVEFGEIKSAFELSGINADNVNSYAASNPRGGVASVPENERVSAGTVSYTDGKIVFDVSSATGKTQLQSIGYQPQFSLNANFFGETDMMETYYVTMKMRVKFKGDHGLDKTLYDYIPMSVAFAQGAAKVDIAGFVWNDTYLQEDGWYERTISVRLTRANIASSTGLVFTFESYHLDKFNMGAIVEISDVYYAAFPYGA